MTNKILIALLMFAAIPFGVMAQDDEVDPTTRKEREHIKAGNALYELQRYAEAEVEYKKALEVNPNSQLATTTLPFHSFNKVAQTMKNKKTIHYNKLLSF